MDPNNNTTTSTSPSVTKSPPSAGGTQTITPTTPSVDKEHEVVQVVPGEMAQEISQEVEIPKEVERMGVTKIREEIELPPDVKKLGVAPSSSTVPVATTILPQIVLPISDQNVLVGLHAKVTIALRWLAVWCIRKLKKAHLTLKVIHGKIIRVRVK